MRMQLVVLGAVAVLGLGGGGIYLWSQYKNQDETNRKLEELTARLNAQTQAAPANSPVIISGAASQDGTVLAKLAQKNNVIKQGWEYINRKKPADAKTAMVIFQEAIEKFDAAEPQYYNGLGRAGLVAGKYWEALAAFKKGLEVDPQAYEMQSGLGWAYWNLGDPYHAKLAWEKTLTIAPRSPDAWSALAWIYLALGEREKSRDGFRYLLQFQKDNSEWNTGLNLAQGGNTSWNAVNLHFKLPPLEAFSTPVPEPVPPASQPASAVSRPATNR